LDKLTEQENFSQPQVKKGDDIPKTLNKMISWLERRYYYRIAKRINWLLGYVNQDVKSTASPTFAALTVTAGVSGTLVLDDGTTEKITLVFTKGVLTSRTVAATAGSALANWTD
jgi:hypothetical protein